MSSGSAVVALDIGGTHVTAGRVDPATATVDVRTRAPLPEDGTREDLVAAIVGAAASTGARASRIGVAVPGPFDYASGVCEIAHKLRALYGVDLRHELVAGLGLPDPAAVRFLNDAHAFLLGESWAGAARGHARAVGVTLGTGLGSAFLVDGEAVHSGPGVPPDGALYRLDVRGAPVEDTISRRGLLARYPAGDVDVEQVAALARAGDPVARYAFVDVAEALAELLLPWLLEFAPTCLVVGGSIARSWGLLAPALRSGLAPVEGLQIVVAERIEDAPLLGAARFVTTGGRGGARARPTADRPRPPRGRGARR
jgi:glucokinase